MIFTSVFRSSLVFTLMLLFSSLVFSGEQGVHVAGPKEVAEGAAKRLTDRLIEDKSLIATTPNRIKVLVEQELLPIFDEKLIARLVMSSSWKKADDAQKEAFMHAFRNILIKTYSNAFSAYDGQDMEFKEPIFNKDKKKAIVRSRILQEEKMPILVDFRLRKAANGWLVYDAVIEGVSIVKSYRSQIKEKISEKGIPLMIKDMEIEACGTGGCEGGKREV
ncbi:MAG: ABC transporter substrate-binding protein [Gammaproteobacteria bacterium]|nr:ABC transporter substrate-binding protein [Gammaproteobacteria bacterium]